MGGFFVNAARDLKGIVTGLGALAGAGVHDVGHGIAEAATLGHASGGYYLDEIAKALPGAIAQDYKSRYGSVSGFEHGLYTHPLGFLTDALSLATLGGSAAAAGAGAAAKAVEGGAVVGRIGELSKAAEVAGAAGDVAKTAELATQVAAEQAKLPTLAQRILTTTRAEYPTGIGTRYPGGVKYIRQGAELVKEPLSTNPLKRALVQGPLARVLSEPVSKIEDQALTLAAHSQFQPALASEAASAMALVEKAKALGLTSIERPSVSNLRLRSLADKLFGDQGTRFITNRNEATKEVADIHKPLSAAELEQAHLNYQGLDASPSPTALEKTAILTSETGAPGGTATAVAERTATAVRPLMHLVDRAMGATEQELPGATAAHQLAAKIHDLHEAAIAKLENPAPGEVAAADAKTEAYVRSLYEPLTTQLRQKAGQPVGAIDTAREAMRGWLMRRLTIPLMERGMLTPAEAFDRQYLPLRLASGANFNLETKAFEGGQGSLALHEARQAAGLHTPVYFPHIDVRRSHFSDYLMPKKTVGLAKMAREGYAKQSTGWLAQHELYQTNPVEAYALRASQAIRAQEIFNMIRETTKLGRPISSLDEISRGERLWAPDGLLRNFHAKIALGDALLSKTRDAASEDSALRAALEAVMPKIQNEVAADLVGISTKGIKLYALPKVIADRLESQAKQLFGTKAKLFVDAPTNLWRSMVLTASPRWVVNNTLGNIIFLKMQGGRLSDVLRQFDPGFAKVLRQVTPDASRGGFFSGHQQYLTKLGSAGDTEIGRAFEALGNARPVRGAERVGEWVRRLNSHIEDVFRMASYMTASERAAARVGIKRNVTLFMGSKARLDRLAELGMEPRVVEQAIKEVNYFLNDYSRMSPFERQVIRRFISPFWSFYRHVARLMVTMPLTHPGRFEMLKQLTNVGNDITSAYGPVPDFLQGDIALGPGAQPGETRFLSTSGPNPFNALFQTPLSLLHPYIKIALEKATGRSTLTGKPFTSPDVVAPFGSSQAFRVNAQGQAEPVQSVAPSWLEEVLREVPQYQLAEQLLGGAKPYDTATLPGIISSRLGGYPPAGAIPTVPGGGAPKFSTDWLQAVSKQLGFSTFDYNLGKWQQRTAQNQQAAITTYLRQIGALPPAGTAAPASTDPWVALATR